MLVFRKPFCTCLREEMLLCLPNYIPQVMQSIKLFLTKTLFLYKSATYCNPVSDIVRQEFVKGQ